MEKTKFYKCGKCGKFHYLTWTGDCKEPHRSFEKDELDKAYGPEGWEKVSDPYSVAK